MSFRRTVYTAIVFPEFNKIIGTFGCFCVHVKPQICMLVNCAIINFICTHIIKANYDWLMSARKPLFVQAGGSREPDLMDYSLADFFVLSDLLDVEQVMQARLVIVSGEGFVQHGLGEELVG